MFSNIPEESRRAHFPPAKVDTWLPGRENSNSRGARPVDSMIKWIWTSRLSSKKSLSLSLSIFSCRPGFRVLGFGFRVSGYGFRVTGFEFHVSGQSRTLSLLSLTLSRARQAAHVRNLLDLEVAPGTYEMDKSSVNPLQVLIVVWFCFIMRGLSVSAHAESCDPSF